MSKADDILRERLAKPAADRSEPDTSDIPEAPPGAWAAAEVGKFHRPGIDRDRAIEVLRVAMAVNKELGNMDALVSDMPV